MIVKALGTDYPNKTLEISNKIDKDNEIRFRIIDTSTTILFKYKVIYLTKSAIKDIYDHLGKLLEK